MRFDVYKNPEPIEFGTGDEAFKLILKAYTGEERMAIFDAVGTKRLADMQYATGRLIVGWANVNAADGKPIPFEELDAKGAKTPNLDKVLGAMPTALHGEIISAVMAFVGYPLDEAQQLARNLGSERDLRPLVRPVMSTAASASPDSASSATSSN